MTTWHVTTAKYNDIKQKIAGYEFDLTSKSGRKIYITAIGEFIEVDETADAIL